MELRQKASAGDATLRQNSALVVGYPDELRLKPTNETLLKKVADASQGQYNATVETLLAATDRTAQRRLPLWPYLLMTALGLFVFDVLLRRIDLSVQRF